MVEEGKYSDFKAPSILYIRCLQEALSSESTAVAV